MSDKTEALARLRAAENGSGQVLDSMGAALAALGRNVSVNGMGVLRDFSAVRGQLLEARTQIDGALKLLDGIEQPLNADYDYI